MSQGQTLQEHVAAQAAVKRCVKCGAAGDLIDEEQAYIGGRGYVWCKGPMCRNLRQCWERQEAKRP